MNEEGHDLCTDPDCHECVEWYEDQSADWAYQDRVERTGVYER